MGCYYRITRFADSGRFREVRGLSATGCFGETNYIGWSHDGANRYNLIPLVYLTLIDICCAGMSSTSGIVGYWLSLTIYVNLAVLPIALICVLWLTSCTSLSISFMISYYLLFCCMFSWFYTFSCCIWIRCCSCSDNCWLWIYRDCTRDSALFYLFTKTSSWYTY